MRYSNQRFHTHTRESCQAYLKSFAGSPNSYLLATFDGNPVGTLTIYRNPNHGTADIGILTYGGGYGQPMWNAALELLTQEGIRKITAGTRADNSRMIKILRASGMRQEAVRQAHEIADDGFPVDLIYWAKFNRPTLAESNHQCLMIQTANRRTPSSSLGKAATLAEGQGVPVQSSAKLS